MSVANRVRSEGIQLPLIPEDEIAESYGSPRDRVPEMTQYQDEGCRFWHACLSCPFPCCVFDLPGGPSQAMHAFRDGEIRRLYTTGVSALEIADRFGLARRSVYRILGGVRRRGGESGIGSRESGLPVQESITCAKAESGPAFGFRFSIPTQLKGANQWN